MRKGNQRENESTPFTSCHCFNIWACGDAMMRAMFPNFTVLYLYLIINFRNCKKVKTHFNTRIPPASSVTKTKPTPTPTPMTTRRRMTTTTTMTRRMTTTTTRKWRRTTMTTRRTTTATTLGNCCRLYEKHWETSAMINFTKELPQNKTVIQLGTYGAVLKKVPMTAPSGGSL